MHRQTLVVLLVLAVCLGAVSSALAQDQTLEDRLKILEQALKKQEETIKEQQKLIKELKTEVGQIKPPEKQVVAQPKPAPPVAGEQAGKPATLAVKKAPVLQPEAAKPASAATPEGTQTAALHEEVEELKEQVGQVAEAQKQEFLSKLQSCHRVRGGDDLRLSQPAQPSTPTSPSREPTRPGGFDVIQRSVELNVAGSVDPFARGYAVLNASADPVTGEATAAVEEAAIVTTSLPWNLTLKAGRFFGEFGRLSYIHDHELPFVNRPLVLDPIHRRRIEDRRGTAQLAVADLALCEPDRGRG